MNEQLLLNKIKTTTSRQAAEQQNGLQTSLNWKWNHEASALAAATNPKSNIIPDSSYYIFFIKTVAANNTFSKTLLPLTDSIIIFWWFRLLR